ncbi:MAG TPA: hypothetical protein VF384_17705 [Planctomycetota bacterium]
MDSLAVHVDFEPMWDLSPEARSAPEPICRRVRDARWRGSLLLATPDAVELLVRIGPPPEIELPALRAFLRQHVNGAVDGHGNQAWS